VRMPSQISIWLSQEACLGVEWNTAARGDEAAAPTNELGNSVNVCKGLCRVPWRFAKYKEVRMPSKKYRRTALAALALAIVLALGGAPAAIGHLAAAGTALSVPPGAPVEDVRDADEWPAPNGDLYNTRAAHTTIAATNVAQLGVAWTLPLTASGANGADVANPVIADGIVYLQDNASNVMAIRDETGQVLWTHPYNSTGAGPNGVTIADGRVYGTTNTWVFALDASRGHQVWYVTQFEANARFDIPPQVAGGRVFVSSAVTVGGGIIYALDARTGATLWSFATLVDPIGQQLKKPVGGVWNAMLIGPDQSVYAGTGNLYISLDQARATPGRELYTDSIVKLDQATGKLAWYYQANPDDFHDWDLQISPIYTIAAGHPVVLAAGKGGFVYAFDPTSGAPLWKTSVGIHNGHDQDGELALEGQLQLTPPYTLLPGEVGGVQTDMATADGVVYVPVNNLPESFTSATQAVGTSAFLKGTGEEVAIDIATGRQLWATPLPQLALGGATVANDLVFTATFAGEVVALSRKDGTIVWTAQLPAGANAPLAIVGDTLLAGAGMPLSATQHPALVAYRLGATTPPPGLPATGQGGGAAPLHVGLFLTLALFLTLSVAIIATGIGYRMVRRKARDVVEPTLGR
jgi:outer membrane protein assembly factor BamB